MSEETNRRGSQQSRQDIRITFGMIVLNAEPFVTYNLRALYPFAHQIIVVEGAVPAGKSVAKPDGHSSDGTLEALRRFKANEDPESKLLLVTAEDDGHPDGFWLEKDEMSQAYAARATGNYLWQTDADEFYLPRDMQSVIDMLSRDADIKAVSFPMRTFWGSPAYLVNGYFLEKFAVHRVFAWGPGYRYTTHRPPTVVDDKSRDLRTMRWLTPEVMRKKGIYLFHYELLFPKQVLEKCQYYAEVGWTSVLRQADEWARTCYFSMTKPFRVHMMYGHMSWLERFVGGHPPQVMEMVAAVRSGRHDKIALRRTDDVERLLSDSAYSIKRGLLKLLVPFDNARAGAKARTRALLKDTPLWALLRAANRRRKGLPVRVDTGKVSERLRDGWQSPSIPDKQRLLTIGELQQMYAGQVPRPFAALAEALQPIHGTDSTMIEIGCSTGYHYEVLRHLLQSDIKYVGADYSYPMIARGSQLYPSVSLMVADATALPYEAGAFDILISGCCLLHIPDYPTAIAESARVARQWVVLHKTPIVNGPTAHFKKKAYGVPCVEIHFNETELLSLCAANALEMRSVIDVSRSDGASYVTYVFEKSATPSRGDAPTAARHSGT
jgi:hypothetical protein